MPTAPGYADCSIEVTLTGFPRPAYLTMGCNPTATDPNAIGASIGGAIAAAGSLVVVLAVAAKYTGVRVSLGTDGGEDLIGFHPMNLTGTNANLTASANVAALVHKRTARGGRRGRGRWFIPWSIADSELTEAGAVTGSRVTIINNACAAFLAALTSASCPMVILHNPSGPGTVHPTTPGPPDVVTSMNCDGVCSTQRRRLGR